MSRASPPYDTPALFDLAPADEPSADEAGASTGGAVPQPIDSGSSSDSGSRPDSGSSSDSGSRPDTNASEDVPLAARVRPSRLDDVIGQDALTGPDGPLRRLVDSDALRSIVLWGPPGTGKTTLARVVAESTRAAFVELSAVTAGVVQVREQIARARARRATARRATVVFIDEIHRFNRAQQDALLPAVEDGSITLIGATTENPSFEVNAPLLSRSMLYRLLPLSDEAVGRVIDRALSVPEGLPDVELEPDAYAALVAAADGDARVALGGLEAAAHAADGPVITADDVRRVLGGPHLRYDKAGDAHYDQLSAFIKSIRGSDPDAAVYWLVRMLDAGEDPRVLARRMIIAASEDVGLADSAALQVATAAWGALEAVGLPEARLALTHAALYLALAPKSHSVTDALVDAGTAVARLGNAEVPAHLRDAHYRGARRLGHGTGYRSPHEVPAGWVDQRYGPDGLEPVYTGSAHGAEPDVQRWRESRS